MKFYRRLFTSLRESRAMTQETLAKAIGVSRQAVQQWEDGTSKPRPANVREAARAFGVSVVDISDLRPGDEKQLPDAVLADPFVQIITTNWNLLTAEERGRVAGFVMDLVERKKTAPADESPDAADGRILEGVKNA